MKNWAALLIGTTGLLGLAGCEDSEERRARYAEKKPAPKPLERTFAPPPPPVPEQEPVKDAGPAMVEYKGEDIVQITGMSGKNILLVFYAPWCIHCAQYRNALVDYALAQRGHTFIVAIDADKYPALAKEYGVEAIPKTVLYVEGMRLRDMVGSISAEKLAELIDKTLEAGDVTRH